MWATNWIKWQLRHRILSVYCVEDLRIHGIIYEREKSMQDKEIIYPQYQNIKFISRKKTFYSTESLLVKKNLFEDISIIMETLTFRQMDICKC